MDVTAAIDALNHVTLWPEWRLIASDYTKRHESAVKIRLEYQVRNSDAEHAPAYAQWVEPFAHAEFALMVGDISSEDVMVLYARAFAVVLGAVEHELREFFGIVDRDNPLKPFHPHTLWGMANWQNYHDQARPAYHDTIRTDITFGSV